MNAELMRIVDSISRDKNIDKEMVITDLEAAIVSAARKKFGQEEDVQVTIDRITGEMSAMRNGEPIDLKELGRIPAQTAKQVMIQKLREAERGSIFEEYSQRKGEIVTGSVARFEGGALVVNLGRTEGFLPKSEQIPGETHHPGERIRALVLDIRELPHQVKIILSRSHPDLIRRLFELEVPEVAERIIEIKALAREAGYRTKIAVSSIDTKVDAVGACVGVRGSRIKNIVDELGGEKIDIVRWNESSQILITNALKPAEIQEIALCFELGRATVVVAEDQLSLAIGKRGQNVRLAARLTGWDIDILTPAEYNKGLDDLVNTLKGVEGVENALIDQVIAMGIISLADLDEVGTEPLTGELGVEAELAERILAVASEAAKRIAAEMEAKKKAEEEAAAAAAAAAAAEAAEGAAAAEGAEGEAESVAGLTTDETAATGGVEQAAVGSDTDMASSEAPDDTAVLAAAEVTPQAETDASAPEAAASDESSGAEAGVEVVEPPPSEATEAEPVDAPATEADIVDDADASAESSESTTKESSSES